MTPATKRYGPLAAALLSAVMLLAACGSSSSSSGGASTGTGGGGSAAAAPSSVTIAGLNANAAFAAQYAAEGNGAFAAVEKKFNTKIKFSQFGTAQDATNAMLGGSAQMSLGALTSFLIIQAGGKDVTTTFAAFIGGGGVLIGAKKYENSRGTDLSKFNGSTFGYTREGSASQLLMRLAAEKSGVKWSDLKHVAFGMPSAGLPLLQAGRVDVAAVDPSTAGQAIGSGKAYLVLNLNDPKTMASIAGQQLGTVYGFNTSFTKQYPALTKAITGAFVSGLNAVKKVAGDPAAVLKLFPSDIQKMLSTDWNASWKLTEPGVTASDGSQPAQAVKDSVSFAQTTGLLNANQAALSSVVVNNTFLP